MEVKLRLAFKYDTPMPYRVSNALSGQFLAMFADYCEMQDYLLGKGFDANYSITIPKDGLEIGE